MNAKILAIIITACGLAACRTQKTAVGSSTTVARTTTSVDNEKAKLDYLDKVNDNASYQKNVSAGITFTVSKDNGKEISVPGQLRMRKDQVIRLTLQVPILGTEVGRIEFGTDYVLFVDRMHKEYVRANYNQVAFLRDNGIDFYSLQALFWNRLLLPGKTAVGYTDLNKFSTDLNGGGQQVPVTLKAGKLAYTWTTDRSNGVIERAKVDYASSTHGTSTLTWDYSDFKTFGSKPFPYANIITIVTPSTGKSKTIKAAYTISSISTNADWDAKTTLSDKYKQVSAEEVLGKLTQQ